MSKGKMLEAKYGSPDKPLKIGGAEIPCYVLEDGKRVIVQAGFLKALGITQNGLISLTDDKIASMLKEPLVFTVNKIIHYGYDALLLSEIARSISKAYLNGDLLDKYISTGIKAETLDGVLSRVGITTLIDEITGYQDVLVKDALEKLFNEMPLEKAQKYQVTFPIELYKQWFRLNGLEWKPESVQKRSGIIGTWTNDMIYDRIAPALLKELQKRNHKEHKHFQFLTDEVSEPKLSEFFGGLMALGRVNTTWRKYCEMVNRAFPKYENKPEKE